MESKAVIRGEKVRFKLHPALAEAQKENAGLTMTEREAIEFVERKRRSRALRRAAPYLDEGRP